MSRLASRYTRSASLVRATRIRPRPLPRAHSHNDYEHSRPLLDALDHGFTSVEADVWLVDGDLLVAHEETELDPARTLRTLYLDPLRSIIEDNGGSAFPHWAGSLQLIVDIKTDPQPTYLALHHTLSRYRELMTRFDDGVASGAVTAIVSGNRPRALMESQRNRLAAYDGRLDDLDSGAPSTFMPLISADWSAHFAWRGTGPMSLPERERLHRLVSRAHLAGYRVRFWAVPEHVAAGPVPAWSELMAAGVDHLNTDDLPGLQTFLLAR